MSHGFSGGSSLINGNLGSATVQTVSQFSGVGLPRSAVKIGNTIWQVTDHGGYNFVLLELDTVTQTMINFYPCTIPYADSSSSIIDGGDGYLYLSAGGQGEPIRFNLTTHVYENLGNISNVLFIFDYCFGNDGNIYGGTNNQARLIKIIPGAGTKSDLGRADPVQTSATTVCTGTGDYVYIGIGPGQAKIVAYDTVLATFTDITPVGAPSSSSAVVWTGIDGNPYALIASQRYSLNGLVATPIGSAPVADDLESTLINQTQIDVFDPNTSITYHMDLTGYSGSPLSIFQIISHEESIYGSGILPAYLFKSTGGSNAILDILGNGEIMSMINVAGKIWMGAYSSDAPIIGFDPSRPIGSGNPQNVTYSGQYIRWRPSSVCLDQNNFVYFGSKYLSTTTEGPLVQFNPYNQTVKTFVVKTNQSPLCVAPWNDMIVFGTNIKGNDVPSPPAQDVVLGIFNPSSETFYDIESFSGFAWLNGLVIYENTAIFIAVEDAAFPSVGHLIFYDLINSQILREVILPWNYGATHSNMINVDGKIFGISDFGDVFQIDPNLHTVRLVTSTVGTASQFGRNCINVSGDLYFQRAANLISISSISNLSGWF